MATVPPPAQADVSSLAYFAPIAAFLLVFLVVYAVLQKSKVLGENKWLNIFVSFVLSTIFIAAASARIYIQVITPWFAVMMITLFFVLLLVGFVGDPMKSWHKGIGAVFVVMLGLIFLVSAFFVFSHLFIAYLPGPGFGAGGDPKMLYFLSWLYSSRVSGTILLILISAGAAWVLVRTK